LVSSFSASQERYRRGAGGRAGGGQQHKFVVRLKVPFAHDTTRDTLRISSRTTESRGERSREGSVSVAITRETGKQAYLEVGSAPRKSSTHSPRVCSRLSARASVFASGLVHESKRSDSKRIYTSKRYTLFGAAREALHRFVVAQIFHTLTIPCSASQVRSSEFNT